MLYAQSGGTLHPRQLDGDEGNRRLYRIFVARRTQGGRACRRKGNGCRRAEKRAAGTSCAAKRSTKENCAACHGDNGLGRRVGIVGNHKGYEIPPVWGPDATSKSASMFRILSAFPGISM